MIRLPKYIQQTQGKLWLTEDERDNLKISYCIKEVLFEETSEFQHVMVLDSYDFGPMLVLDGAVQTTSKDGFVYNEMIAHVPLSLHPDPKHVLIIGGGDCGAAREAAKYSSIERIDMVEIDELVVTASKKYMPEVSGNLSDPRVNFIYADGVKFAKQVKAQYDVIIVDSSDPVGPAVQLFESAFYQSLHDALKDGGMMVCQSQSPIFHPEVMKQSYDRIDQIFADTRLYTAVVPTYPGGLWSFTIGSKIPIKQTQQAVYDKDTQYFNEHIFNGCFQLPAFLQKILAIKPVMI